MGVEVMIEIRNSVWDNPEVKLLQEMITRIDMDACEAKEPLLKRIRDIAATCGHEFIVHPSILKSFGIEPTQKPTKGE
jgi:hypothetical protein